MINSLPKIYFELFAVIGISFIIYFYIIVKSDVNAALPIMGVMQLLFLEFFHQRVELLIHSIV